MADNHRTCDIEFVDADGDSENGCESKYMCEAGGACTTACGTTGENICVNGSQTCEPPSETCNGVDDNCNGECDEGRLDGCRVGIHRAYGNGHYYNDVLAEANANPFNVEFQDYFFLYREQGSGMRPYV